MSYTQQPMTTQEIQVDVINIDILVKYVCPHLSAQEIERIHQVDKNFRAAIKDEDYGKELFRQHWEDVETTNPSSLYKLKYTLKDGKQEGQYKQWHANGQLWDERTYKDGNQEGQHKQWHANGQLWDERTYKDGKLDGLCKYWYETGQLQGECTYKDGKLDGLYKYWYANGQLGNECTYKDGKLDGLWSTVGRVHLQGR